jgi:nucleoside-diphosphate-sugar epimerase
MRILITGSSGQIGTNLGLYLREQGHFVFGVDKRPNSWTDAIPTQLQDLSIPARRFEKGIGDVDYPADLDAVVHFAAHAKVHELVEQPGRALENITITFNVLEFCRRHNLPLIFSSSREVYGDIHRYITEESYADFAFTESPYSASKISGEALIYSYAQCYGLRYLVFRFSNVYGRYDNDLARMERVIPLFIHKIKNGEPITVYGEDKVLDFTYIDDCVQGLPAACGGWSPVKSPTIRSISPTDREIVSSIWLISSAKRWAKRRICASSPPASARSPIMSPTSARPAPCSTTCRKPRCARGLNGRLPGRWVGSRK